MDYTQIFTDGSCLGCPGQGGWAAIIVTPHTKELISGAEPFTSNNRMEIKAVSQALKHLGYGSDIIINTDSSLVLKGMSSMCEWESRRWKTKNRKPVQHHDLWKEILGDIQSHTVHVKLIKGHSGILYNDLADFYAGEAARSQVGMHLFLD